MSKPKVKIEVLHALREVRRQRHDGDIQFCIVDVIAALALSSEPRKYWSKLKQREIFQLSPKWRQLKFKASDGKVYGMDAAGAGELSLIFGAIALPANASYRFLTPEQWYWLLTGNPMPVHPGPDDLPRDDDGIDVLYLGDLCNILERNTGLEQGPFIFIGNHPDGRTLVTDRKLSVVAAFPPMDKHHLVIAVDRDAARNWQPGKHFKDHCREIRQTAIDVGV